MRFEAERRAASRLAAPVALLVVLLVAGGYVFLTRSKSGVSESSISTSLSPNPLNATVAQVVQDYNQRDVDGLASFYTSNSVLVWSGALVGLQGRYTGGNIMLLYAATIGKSSTVNASISNFAQKVISPTVTNATFVVHMLANSTVAGIVTATIDATQEWNWNGAKWQILKENWAYSLYDSSYVDEGLPSVTTFPQWGYELKGGNPNLVSEKSFEWHAGPFVAASVYAFLIGVLVLGAFSYAESNSHKTSNLRLQSSMRWDKYRRAK
ncbi:MAG TPA: hypothetical protein VLY21_01050 [Nitrososphaerales archaeon]|nr:hypothetical protein [Nitrososphaerales archaeon]